MIITIEDVKDYMIINENNNSIISCDIDSLEDILHHKGLEIAIDMVSCCGIEVTFIYQGIQIASGCGAELWFAFGIAIKELINASGSV
jgi:hypothetical protein